MEADQPVAADACQPRDNIGVWDGQEEQHKVGCNSLPKQFGGPAAKREAGEGVHSLRKMEHRAWKPKRLTLDTGGAASAAAVCSRSVCRGNGSYQSRVPQSRRSISHVQLRLPIGHPSAKHVVQAHTEPQRIEA